MINNFLIKYKKNYRIYKERLINLLYILIINNFKELVMYQFYIKNHFNNLIKHILLHHEYKFFYNYFNL